LSSNSGTAFPFRAVLARLQQFSEEEHMANAAEHMTASGIAGAITYLAMCRYYHRHPTIGGALTGIGVAVVSGMGPDLLEPALHPNHRQFCHSITAGALVLKAGTSICNDANRQWTELAKIVTACIIVGYLTHLVLDACTQKGLPILGKPGA